MSGASHKESACEIGAGARFVFLRLLVIRSAPRIPLPALVLDQLQCCLCAPFADRVARIGSALPRHVRARSVASHRAGGADARPNGSDRVIQSEQQEQANCVEGSGARKMRRCDRMRLRKVDARLMRRFFRNCCSSATPIAMDASQVQQRSGSAVQDRRLHPASLDSSAGPIESAPTATMLELSAGSRRRHGDAWEERRGEGAGTATGRRSNSSSHAACEESGPVAFARGHSMVVMGCAERTADHTYRCILQHN